MADEGSIDTSATDTAPEAAPVEDQLGEGGQKALAEERKNRKAAERQLSELTKQLQTLQDAQRTDAERTLEEARREAADQASAPLQRELARLKVALAKGLSADDLEFLTGDTEEEMTARADKLLERFGQAKSQPPSFNGGPRQTGTAASFNDMIRRAAGRTS